MKREKPVRESQVATALKRRLEHYGCDWRRVEWIGRHSCPDIYALLTPVMSRRWGFPRNPWIETKRPTKDANEAQAREHRRMRDAGDIVLIIRDLETLDRWFPVVPEASWDDFELSVICTNRLKLRFPKCDPKAVFALDDLTLKRLGFRMRDVKDIREAAANSI